MTGGIRVLHVDDDPALLDLTATFLERENEGIAVATATSTSEGLARVDEGRIDCIVSDYDMPERNGLEFLESVRSEGYDLPFILFTGKGSEEIASEAISAGVTDYLQKQPGVEQYTMLANRVENAVDRHRAHEAQSESEHRYRRLVDQLPVGIAVHRDGELVYANGAAATLVGETDPTAVVGETVCSYVAPDDRPVLADRIDAANEAGGSGEWLEFDLGSGDRRVTVEAIDSAITFEGRPATQVILREVTAERELRTRLKRSEKRYRAVSEAVTDALVVLEAGTVVDVNGAACELLERSREELVGTDGPDLCPADAREAAEACFDPNADEASSVEAILEVTVGDGTPVSVSVAARAVEFRGGRTVYASLRRRDSTPRRPAPRFDAVVDSLVDGALLLEGDRIRWATDGVAETLETDREALTGRPWTAIVDDADEARETLDGVRSAAAPAADRSVGLPIGDREAAATLELHPVSDDEKRVAFGVVSEDD